MPAEHITRRRVLTILAASAAVPLLGGSARARAFEWRGTALGADTRLLLWAQNREHARQAIDICVAEIERLEQIFSLYRSSSELSRLNRNGTLDAPSHDMVRLLHLSCEISRLTGGLFDPTVQSLWELYAGWYAENPERKLPPDKMIAEARACVGIDRVRIEPGQITCDSGARLTLNGIAQGYITDRVADLLRARGWQHVLIDLGEVRALDGRPDGSDWQVGIRESGFSLPLSNAALATSSGGALRFGASGNATHILNPLTGRSPAFWRSVTVRHASAAFADALSTALFAAAPGQLNSVTRANRGVRVWATQFDDTVARYGG